MSVVAERLVAESLVAECLVAERPGILVDPMDRVRPVEQLAHGRNSLFQPCSMLLIEYIMSYRK